MLFRSAASDKTNLTVLSWSLTTLSLWGTFCRGHRSVRPVKACFETDLLKSPPHPLLNPRFTIQVCFLMHIQPLQVTAPERSLQQVQQHLCSLFLSSAWHQEFLPIQSNTNRMRRPCKGHRANQVQDFSVSNTLVH